MAIETKPATDVATNPTNKELAKTTRDKFVALVNSEKLNEQMVKSVYDNNPCTVRRIGALMLNAAVKAPALYEATQASVMKVLLDCCAYGIEPNGRDAHVLPYRNRKAGTVEAQLMIDYKGMITLAAKSERVSSVFAEVVCKNDVFTWKNGVIDHEVNFFEERGDVIGVYAVATMKDGAKITQVLSKKEVDATRSRSRSKDSGPWVTDYNEMAKKSAVRRLSKYLPLSPSAVAAIEADDEHNFDFSQQQPVSAETTARRKQSADAIISTLAAEAKADAMDEVDTVEAEVVD